MIYRRPVERKACIIYYGNNCYRSTPLADATTVALDEYVLDSLMPDLVGHDRQPSAFFVYVTLWRLSHGSGRSTVQVALQDIAEGTGLSKRSVQDALRWLVKRKLVHASRASITAVPIYTVLRPWRR